MSSAPKGRRNYKPRESRNESLLVTTKYTNKLPDLPFAPKFLAYPFDLERFVHYKQTELEKNFKQELLVGRDLGIEVNLIDGSLEPGRETGLELDPRDEALLKDAEVVSKQDKKRKARMEEKFSWLRKTTYIGSGGRHFGHKEGSVGMENKIGVNLKPTAEEEELDTKDAQIRLIQNQFEMARAAGPIKHPTKKNLTVVSSIPVLPDFKFWRFELAHGVFDSDPAPLAKGTNKKTPADVQRERAYESQCILSEDGCADDTTALYWPTRETFESRKRRREAMEGDPEWQDDVAVGDKYEFKKLREYTYEIKTKDDMPEETLYFVKRDDGAGEAFYYKPLGYRVKLTRNREARQGGGKKGFLTVTHRDYDAGEEEDIRVNEAELLPPREDGEDEEDEPEPEPEADGEVEAEAEGEEHDMDLDADSTAKPDAAADAFSDDDEEDEE